MRFFFLTLMVVACGKPPVSTTQFLRASTAGEGQLAGCIRPDKGLPAVVDNVDKFFRFPKATALFAQQQDNGQHCLYAQRVSLKLLGRDDVRMAGFGKAMTKFSVTSEDVQAALQAQYVAQKLKILFSVVGGGHGVAVPAIARDSINHNRCRDPEYLYREFGDIFRDDTYVSQHIDRLRDKCGDSDAAMILHILSQIDDSNVLTNTLKTAAKIFAGNSVVTYYDVTGNIFYAPLKVIAPYFLTNKEQQKAVTRIIKVLPWVRSTSASICQKHIRI